MLTPEIFEYCKMLVRQKSTTAFDEEINTLINAAYINLNISAIDKVDNDLVKQAVGIYVKANFGSENPDRENLLECFEALKTHIAITKTYGQVLPSEETL